MSTRTLLYAWRLSSRRTVPCPCSILPIPQHRALATYRNFHIWTPAAPGPIYSVINRAFASSSGRSPADEIAENMQHMFAEAKDEFEIAVESTEANAVYAQSDRDATREELEKLKKAWEEAIAGEGEVQQDLRSRPIGQRIRELENAVIALEKRGTEEA